MLAQIFQITAPVFLMALAGWVWARMRRPFDLEFVTRLSLSISLPCLIFATLVKADIDPAVVRDLTLASLIAYGVLALVAWVGLRLARLSIPVWLAPVVFGNTGNVGLPVVLFAYGDQGLALAMVVFAVMAVLSFTFGVYVVAGVGRPAEALKQPLVYASALGGLFVVTDWPVPEWILTSLSLAGQIAIPLMLLTLGVSIARLRPADLGLPVVLSVLKLGITAAVAWGVADLLGFDGMARGVLVLQLIMPAAVTNYLLAARYDRSPDAVAGLVVVSTFVSLVAIPAALALLL